MKLVTVGAGRFYEINMGLEHRREFVALLRAMGITSGLADRNRKKGFFKNGGATRAPAIAAPLPPDLFWTKSRTRFLQLVTALHETYGQEAGEVFGMSQASALTSLRTLFAEGALNLRPVKRANCYSINLENGYGNELETLLRRIAQNDRYIVNCANAAFARRLEVERIGSVRERHMFANMTAAWTKSQRSIQNVERTKKPRKRWRRLHGWFSGMSWWRTRNRRGRYRLSDMQRSAFTVLKVTRLHHDLSASFFRSAPSMPSTASVSCGRKAESN